jgi:hypothetical protein
MLQLLFLLKHSQDYDVFKNIMHNWTMNNMSHEQYVKHFRYLIIIPIVLIWIIIKIMYILNRNIISCTLGTWLLFLFKKCLPKKITLVFMWKTYMFNHGGDFLGGKKINIPNKIVIRISIWVNVDDNYPFKLLKWFSTNFFWKNAIPYWFSPWFFIVQWKFLSTLNMKIVPFFCFKIYLKF